MKLAIVHDYLNQHGGAENVVEALHELYPEAPVFTSIFRPEKLQPTFLKMDVRTSFLQNWPFMGRHFKKYLPFYPRAIESFDLSGFDLILSSSSAFAKGAIAPPGALHLCYCYSPMRFVWCRESYLEKEAMNPLLRALLPPVLDRLKRWDLRTVDRVHRYVAISRYIQKRIQGAYQRDSDVIYPPVEVSRFHLSERVEDYFLVVSRLNAYKNIDLVIETFNRLGLPLVVIGTGPHEAVLRRMAGKTVAFLGRVPQDELAGYLSRCRAFIFPGEEDFGIAPVEAMASGRPVIAFGRGGVLETVVDGVTGVFFSNPTVESLSDAIRRASSINFDPAVIRGQAEKFDKEHFKHRIGNFIREEYRRFNGRPIQT